MIQLIVVQIQKMGKQLIKVQEKMIKKTKEYHQDPKQEDSIYCQENSTHLGNQLAKKEDHIEASLVPKQTSKIKVICKDRANRSFKPEDRFLPQHIKRYYLFPFHYSTQFSFFKISWKNWKPNGIYKKMANFLSNIDDHIPNKTSSQCKSYDQRMKYLHYQSPLQSTEVDLLEAALNNLQKYVQDVATKSVLIKYLTKMGQKSQYINFLNEEKAAYEQSDFLDVQKIDKQQERKVSYELVQVGTQRDLIFNEFFDDGDQNLAAKVF